MSNSRILRQSNSLGPIKSSIFSALGKADVFRLLNKAAQEYEKAKQRRDEAERRFALLRERISGLIRRMGGGVWFLTLLEERGGML